LRLQVLGKEFKESMPKLKAAIGKLGRDQIIQFQTTGSLLVEGCLLKEGALKVNPPFPYLTSRHSLLTTHSSIPFSAIYCEITLVSAARIRNPAAQGQCPSVLPHLTYVIK
jgi:hypothetical protein